MGILGAEQVQEAQFQSKDQLRHPVDRAAHIGHKQHAQFFPTITGQLQGLVRRIGLFCDRGHKSFGDQDLDRRPHHVQGRPRDPARESTHLTGQFGIGVGFERKRSQHAESDGLARDQGLVAIHSPKP